MIGQYRSEKKRTWESPDRHNRFPFGASDPIVFTVHQRKGLGAIAACAGCGRTKDLWEANNGEGISKSGRRFCCKPCAEGKPCVCAEMDRLKGQSLNGLQRRAIRRHR